MVDIILFCRRKGLHRKCDNCLPIIWIKWPKKICGALHDLVPCAQFKKRKNIHGGGLLLVKLQASACNFTKSNTPPRVFFTFFKLYEWYQIAQSTTYGLVYNLLQENSGLSLRPDLVRRGKLFQVQDYWRFRSGEKWRVVKRKVKIRAIGYPRCWMLLFNRQGVHGMKVLIIKKGGVLRSSF